MAMVGGDPGSIRDGGELLRRCAANEESLRTGFEAVRAQAVTGCDATGAELVGRWAAAHQAVSEDLGRELAALGVLASSTAADLTAAAAVDRIGDWFGVFGEDR